MSACHPEILVNHRSDLSFSKEPDFFFQKDHFPEIRALNVLLWEDLVHTMCDCIMDNFLKKSQLRDGTNWFEIKVFVLRATGFPAR